VSKLLDAAQEAAETQVWLDFALQCKYVKKDSFDKLDDNYEHIFAMLASMQRKSGSFCKSGE
jgi:four helix bundle protein